MSPLLAASDKSFLLPIGCIFWFNQEANPVFVFFNIYLAVAGLVMRSTRNLQLWHVGSLVAARRIF